MNSQFWHRHRGLQRAANQRKSQEGGLKGRRAISFLTVDELSLTESPLRDKEELYCNSSRVHEQTNMEIAIIVAHKALIFVVIVRVIGLMYVFSQFWGAYKYRLKVV